MKYLCQLLWGLYLLGSIILIWLNYESNLISPSPELNHIFEYQRITESPSMACYQTETQINSAYVCLCLELENRNQTKTLWTNKHKKKPFKKIHKIDWNNFFVNSLYCAWHSNRSFFSACFIRIRKQQNENSNCAISKMSHLHLKQREIFFF